MTPELIEACAKLCGWHKVATGNWAGRDQSNTWLQMTNGNSHLTDAGLLAVEDALLRKGWNPKPWSLALGYRWVKGKKFRAQSLSDLDRTTAAALAAKAEVKR